MNKEVDLLKGPIISTLVTFSIPIMTVSFMQMAYNLTDIFFVGQLGVQAVAATGTMGYFLWVGESLMHMPQLGVRVLGAQRYGAGQTDRVVKSIACGGQIAFALSLVFAGLLFFANQPLIAFFHLEPQVAQLAGQYSRVMAWGMPFSFLAPILSAAFNSIGNSQTPFRINMLGLLANVILNPIFIFGLGPFVPMGVAGAALGTVLAKALVFFLLWRACRQHETLLAYIPWFKRASLKDALEVIKIGLPSAAQSLVHVFVSMFLNRLVASYGSVAVAVFSTGSQFESISWLTSEGFAYGLTAFIGQNYGARLKNRIQEGTRKGLLVLAILGLVATSLLIGFRYQLFPIFIPNDQQAMLLGANYLLILGFSQFFMCIEIGSTGIFQGLGQTAIPSSIGILFNLLRIPLAIVLTPVLGLNGVWWALTLSSIMKGILAFSGLLVYNRRMVYPKMV
ncbi:MATE family efflux transporter [Vaginisenegalia massiliensis]|uniref:MATE family efflux transporter n=1 Tax=Vaginisenegalia massiliensis TaxID=2058294 RepID=UPI0013DDF946|nr:MATE family efflux transporter [Vaginisenegalia massiliensis]